MIRWISMALLIWSFPPATCRAQTVTVRAIDARTGRGVTGKIVHLYLRDPSTPNEPTRYLEGKTNKEGKAMFRLPSPLPKRVGVFLQFKSWAQCSPRDYATETVLRSGVVAENHCPHTWKNPQQLTAEPGEIIVFTQYIAIWERLKSFPV